MQSNLYQLLVVLYITIQGVLSTHFRGAVFMVRPKPGGRSTEMEIYFHISWRRDRSDTGGNCDSNTVNTGTLIGGNSLTCQYGCSVTISSLQYFCTEYSVYDNWSFGSNVITYDFSTYSGGLITVGTKSVDWISPIDSAWNVSTTFNLMIRRDNHRINSSPRAVSLPLRIQSGCHHIIPMAVSDPDGDVVHCRWAVGKECEGICNGIPGAVLNSTTCTITYQANNGTGYKAVAIMVEDFIPGSSQPLSSVAFQFLVLVVSSDQSCNKKPIFLAPTPSSGSCISIPPGGTFTTELRVNSRSSSISITDIYIASPIGTNKGGLQRGRNTRIYYVTIRWTPKVDQQNMTHHFCFMAVNSEGIGSDQSCIELAVAPYPTSNSYFITLSDSTIDINFNRQIRPTTVSAFIIIYEYSSDVEVYRIDVSSSSEVTFDKPTTMTIRPRYTFTEGSIYYIRLDKGVVWSDVECNTNIAITDNSLLFKTIDPTLYIIDDPTDTSAAAPFSGVFTCSAGGDGSTLVAEWKRSGSSLPSKSSYSTNVLSSGITTSSLVIPNVTNGDVGSYYCLVWRERRAVQSKSAHLAYAGSPVQPWIVLPDPLVNLTINNYNLTMKCMPDSNKLQYYWERQSNDLPSKAHGVNLSLLTITDLRPEDSGDYRCTVSNSTGRITSEYVKLVVQASSPLIMKHPKSVKVDFYKAVTFVCTVQAFGYIQVTWKKVGSNLPVTATVNNTVSINEVTSVLTITGVSGYYKGLYYCIAKNGAGVTVSKHALLRVTVPLPEILEPLKNITVPLQQTASLCCLAISHGVLNYNWRRLNRKKFSSSVSTSYTAKTSDNFSLKPVMYQLQISNVQLSDEGWYCCVATNPQGKTEKCIWLEVATLPMITKSPTSITVRAGSENVSPLWCSATGMGPIHYRWEKYQPPDDSWKKPSKRASDIKSSKLVFSTITEKDEGVYHCIVTNDDGSVVSDNATITVYGPPTITSVSSETTSFEDNKVHLMCNATNDVDALDEVKVVWLRKISGDVERVIKTDGRIIIYNRTDSSTDETHSVLLFDPVNHSDDGKYICRALNHPESSSEKLTNLIIKYAPILTLLPDHSPYHVNVHQQVQLRCIARGLPLPTVQWFSNGMAVSSARQQEVSVTVQTSHPHTKVYICVGVNRINNVEQRRSAEIKVIVGEACPTLVHPANGMVVELGQNAFYVCNAGYTVIGNPSTTCMGGKWTSSPPICKLPSTG